MYKRILLMAVTIVLSTGISYAADQQKEKSFTDLLKDTKSFSGRIRATAIASIGEESTPAMIQKNKIIELLMDILKNDPNLRVRREAISVFALFSTKGINPKKMAKLAKPIMEVASDKQMPVIIRRDAISLSSSLVSVEDLEYDLVRSSLLEILEDKKETGSLRSQALNSLASFGGDKNLAVIMSYLKSKNEDISSAAVLALASVADNVTLDKHSLNIVIGIIKETDDDDALLALLKAVSQIQIDPKLEKDVQKLVKKFIVNENEEVMIYAAVIAQNINYVKIIPTIGERLAKPFADSQNAIRLVDVLAGFSDRLSSEIDKKKLKKNIKYLQTIYGIYSSLLSTTSDSDLGAALAWVYGDIPAILDRNKPFDDLVALVKVDGPIGVSALNSLKMISGELYGPDQEKWKSWKQKNQKRLKAKKIK